MIKLIIIICFCTFSQFLSAQENHEKWLKKISDFTLTKGEAYDHLYTLCKQIGNRISGSPAMYKAEKWGFGVMTQMNADTVYYQECKVPKWVRGSKEEVTAIIKKGVGNTKLRLPLKVLALGNSEGTNLKTIEAPLLIVKNFEELEKIKNNVKGTIVFFNYPFDQRFVRTFQGYGDAVRYRGNGASIAAKYGAVGVLVRSVTTAHDNHPHTGSLRYNDSFPKIPAFAVGVKDAWQLENINQSQTITIQMKNNAQMQKDTIAHNVIGEIRGSLYPEKIITIGGHLDSWDIGEGAHDDGAGMVHAMELIHIFKNINYQPKHTIRIVLFANEENGLRGGTKYAEVAVANNEQHIAAIESDAGGFSPRAFTGTMNDKQLEILKSFLSFLKPYGITEITAGGGGADIGPLHQKLATPVIGLSPDSQRYFDYHHAATDVFEVVNKRELLLGATVIAQLVYLIDNNPLQ